MSSSNSRHGDERPNNSPPGDQTGRGNRVFDGRVHDGRVHDGRPRNLAGRTSRLLPCRTIRAKLFFGVITLSAMTVVLAMTGLLGFYRYKQLSESISQRATELPLATHLSQCAVAAQVSNGRLCRLLTQTHHGMIETQFHADSSLQFEQSEFDHALLALRVNSDLYGDRIGVTESPGATPETHDMLIDVHSQRASLRAIQESIAGIEQLLVDPRSRVTFGGGDQNDLTQPLAELVQQTSDHLSLMHVQMAEFSDHVKGQHKVRFVFACIILAFALTLTGAMIWFFKTTVIAPFRILIEGSRLVAEENQLEHRITLGTNDELSELAEWMNKMADRFQQVVDEKAALIRHKDEEVQQRSREVIRNEQLAGVGFLAAGFAHEINNPMATIAWSAEALESRVSDLLMLPETDRQLDEELTTTLCENLQRIQSEAFRCKSITEKMLSFSRLGNVERTETDMGVLVRDVAEMVGTVGKYRCKHLRVHCNDQVAAVFAYANPPEMRQVILNLITNAMECVAEDGEVDVYVQSGIDEAVIRVRDDGCGMTAEVREHLFEPFFTRRRDGTGTGLGLSISSRIVCQHGGSLDADSDGEGCGSEFVLRLPSHPITQDSSTNTQSWKRNHVQAEAA